MSRERAFLLSSMPPTREQQRLALAVATALFVAFLLTLPFLHRQLPRTDAFIPIVDTALFLNDLITAVLLYVQFTVVRSRGLLALAGGYLFTALIIVPHALTFPGTFAPAGLLGGGLQSTVWLYIFWHLGLPLSAIAYTAWKGKFAPPSHTRSSAAPIALSIGVVAAFAVALTLLATLGVGALPAIMVDASHANFWWRDVAAPPIALIFLASIVLLWRRRSSVLDLWLLVVMWAWFIEILLLSLTSYRFSLVWYAGRIFGLLSSSFVLLVLLSESTMLYARLAASVAAQERAREHQRMTVEVMLASIAHELHQPLSAIVVNATAGLRMLFRRSPDWDNARATLEDINRDGRRATEIVESVRTMFSVSHDTVKLDINDLIREALTIVRMDLKNYGISVQFDEAALPVVRGHRGQLLQVVLNIVTNAVDAMTETHDRTRQLNIQSSMQGLDQVSVTIQDSGKGISPGNAERIFEPFFTTKSQGMGLGLAICRSIVEGHGGRLSVSPVDGYGCLFSISLPVAASDEPKAVQTNRALAS